MRMRLLRMRGELQRAEAAAALGDLRQGARRLGRVMGVLGAVSGASAADAGWVAPLLVAMRERPWLASLALVALRSARKHPAVLLLAAGSAAFAWWSAQRKTAPPASPRGAETAMPSPARAAAQPHEATPPLSGRET